MWLELGKGEIPRETSHSFIEDAIRKVGKRFKLLGVEAHGNFWLLCRCRRYSFNSLSTGQGGGNHAQYQVQILTVEFGDGVCGLPLFPKAPGLRGNPWTTGPIMQYLSIPAAGCTEPGKTMNEGNVPILT